MMHALNIFDGSRAIARLLILLHDKRGQGLPVTGTHRLMKERFSVARIASDSSLRSAIELGLVEQYKSGEYTLNILTARGDVVAVKVKELEKALTDDLSES